MKKNLFLLLLLLIPARIFWASWQYDVTYYSDAFEGGWTALGDVFRQDGFSSAVCEIPLGSLIGLSLMGENITLKVNDRPNCARHPDLIDVTKQVFLLFAPISRGKIPGGEITTLGTLPEWYEKKTLDEATFSSLGILLDENIPNTFRADETLRFRGKVTNQAKFITVLLSGPENRHISFTDTIEADGTFSLILPWQPEPGKYSLALTTDQAGKISVPIWILDEEILDTLPIPAVGQKDSFPTFSLLSELLPLTRIAFGDDFYVLSIRQWETEIRSSGVGEVLLDVNSLTSGTASVSLVGYTHSTPFSLDVSGKYTLFEGKTITLVPQYPKLLPAGARIIATRSSGILRFTSPDTPRIEGDVYVTFPSGTIRRYSLPTEYVDSDGLIIPWKSVVFSFPIEGDGVYLVEISDTTGKAWMNTPLITGRDIYPVLPSPYYGVLPKKETSMENVRANQLALINTFRTTYHLSTLVEDSTLTRIAQEKADDMLANNYIWHTNSLGKTIGQTWESLTSTLIGENVAGGNQGDTILFEGLKLSGSHRYNLLSPEWKKVGIGYAIHDGNVYLVQIFGN